VVRDLFLFAYNADDLKARRRSEKFKIASNRYLLTVTMTNFTPRFLMNERNDVVFERGKSSSRKRNKNARIEMEKNGGIIFLIVFGEAGLFLYLKK